MVILVEIGILGYAWERIGVHRRYVFGLLFFSLPGIAIVTAVSRLMAHPVPGVGIGEPVFIPPLVTTAVALLISRENVPPLACIPGSPGALIGADLLNLNKLSGLGAPVVSPPVSPRP